MWKIIAKLLARPAIANRLIAFAMRTPYLHLPSNEDPSYMARYWVFNPYNRTNNKPRFRWCPWSIRVHHIKRADAERHMHDHPWNARTVILKGGYVERRNNERDIELFEAVGGWPGGSEILMRNPGDTAVLGFEQYHRIAEVCDGGAWTLFISGPWQGVWGFMVDGVKIKWREYLGLDQ